MKKQYRIRKGSIADFVIRNRKGLAMIAATSIVLAGMSAATLAFAIEKPAEPDDNQPQAEEMAEPVEIQEPAQKTWDVPLEAELQIFIADLCAKNHIAPELVLAVIGQESNYRADAIGDSGNSFGLMQIQKRYHLERMERLGVTDLLNPYENVAVGVDIIAEKLAKGSTTWALMAYNGGESYANALQARGEISDYAEAVLQAAELLQRG